MTYLYESSQLTAVLTYISYIISNDELKVLYVKGSVVMYFKVIIPNGRGGTEKSTETSELLVSESRIESTVSRIRNTNATNRLTVTLVCIRVCVCVRACVRVCV
jgi:hypothetical protein